MRLVLWGPPGSAKSALLARIHSACEAPSRGGRVRLEEGSNAAGQVEYAFLDLPPHGLHQLRLHCLTAGDSSGLEDLRRRLLAETDLLLFVLPAGPGARSAAAASWRELVGHLAHVGPPASDLPLAVLVRDAADVPLGGVLLPPWLADAGPAPTGCVGVRVADDVFEVLPTLVASAASRALPPGRDDPDAARYASKVGQRFRPETAVEPDPPAPLPWEAPAPASDKEVVHWMKVREADLKELDRERSLRRLLIEIGAVCAAADDVPTLARGLLVRLVMNLDATTGWLALPRSDGRRWVHGTRGVESDSRLLDRVARELEERAPVALPVPVDESVTAVLPGDAAGGRGLFISFPVAGPRTGWLLLLGPRQVGLPPDVGGVLPTALQFLGLAVARMEAITALREGNHRLEETVAERTEALREEKESLERRVRMRTQELEIAKRAALESERRMLDRERQEGVHRLAAGIAHEINNPLGAMIATLDFVAESLERWSIGTPVDAEDLAEVGEAVGDSRADARRIAGLVGSLFGQAVTHRLAAVRTDVGAAVRDAVRHLSVAVPDLSPPVVREHGRVACGIPTGELVRWLFRLLTHVAECGAASFILDVGRHDGRPSIEIWAPGKGECEACPGVEELASEVRLAGADLVADRDGETSTLRIDLPPGIGEMGTRSVEEAVS